MATPEATTKANLGSCAVHGDGGAPRRRPNAARRVVPRPRHTRRLTAAFPHLPQSLLVEMAKSLEEARFRPGAVIVREGDPADRFYIIESGQVEAAQSTAEEDVHVRTMGAGEYFGEVGLLATKTRTATVRTVSEVRVLSLGRARSRRSWRRRNRPPMTSPRSSPTATSRRSRAPTGSRCRRGRAACGGC